MSIDLGIAGLTEAEEIGRGGFGVVYRATQTAVGRSVAVKMLPSVAQSDDARRRFEREGKAMAAVSSHPNIVSLYDTGVTSEGRPYIVMEYVPGGAYAERMPLPWQQAVDAGVKLAGALETAHRAGIIHRDVKPENILLSSYGEPELTDFGIAKVAESSETAAGGLTASLLHAAPETLSGSRPTGLSDVYSLASTIYALIAGRAAFAAPEPEDTLAPLLTRISTAPVPDLRDRGVPDAVFAVLAQAMSKEAEARPSTPAEFGRQLTAAQRSAGLTPTVMLIEGVEHDHGAQSGDARVTRHIPPAPPPDWAGGQRPGGSGRRRMLILAAVAVVVLVAGIVAVVIATSGGGSGTSAEPTTTPTTSTPSATPSASAPTTLTAYQKLRRSLPDSARLHNCHTSPDDAAQLAGAACDANYGPGNVTASFRWYRPGSFDGAFGRTVPSTVHSVSGSCPKVEDRSHYNNSNKKQQGLLACWSASDNHPYIVWTLKKGRLLAILQGKRGASVQSIWDEWNRLVLKPPQ